MCPYVQKRFIFIRSFTVSYADGHSDDLDSQKKYGAIWFFAADLGEGGYIRGGGGAIYEGAIHEVLQ